MNHPVDTETFDAFYIHAGRNAQGKFEHSAGIESLTLADLADGDVVIDVQWSSVNYKDALAGTGKGRILRNSPLVGGIDLAGTVRSSEDDGLHPGDEVLVTGCSLSETRDGGYAQLARVPAEAVIKLPAGLSLREAMALGTAGLTAGLALWQMERGGQSPDDGSIVVTGATGGVGMLSINIAHHAGYEVHAITGKEDRFEFLREIGAVSCISRHGLHWGQRPLESATWAGAIDSVGGTMLEGLTRVIKPYGNIACCGLAGGDELHTTVMPFIIRGVSLLGVASAGTPRMIREQVWKRLASDWKPPQLDKIATDEVDLKGLPDVFATMLKGDSFGRTLVRVN